jgi:cell division protein FtsQ
MTPRNRRVAPPDVPADVMSVRSARTANAEPSASSAVRDTGSPFVQGVRAVLGALLVLALSTAVAWAARRHVLESPRFAVEDITVNGAHLRSVDTVVTESGVAKGMNVFGLDLDRARARLLADPWIEKATLTRQLPGRVVIDVSERELGAIVSLPEPYLAARDGRIFKRMEVSDPSDLPIVTGLTSDAVAQDREGAQRLILRALDLAGEYEHGPLAARAPLQEIHVSNGGELTIVVGKDGVSLALGLPPFRRKLEEAGRILAELDRRGSHATIVMLDDEARPDRVVVRTR